MKLNSITFTFENCDYITIDGKYIGRLLVDDIQTSIQRVACNSIQKMDVANTFVIEIHKDANIERYQHYQTDYEDFKQMTFDRFAGHDITAIEFEFEEEKEEDNDFLPIMEHYNYYLNWTGDNECWNESQINYISTNGHLYIVVSKDESIEDYFDMEAINNNEYMNYYWEMLM